MPPQRLQHGVERIADRAVQVPESRGVGRQRTEQLKDRVLVVGVDLQQRCGPCGGAVDERPVAVGERVRVGELRHRRVSPLPGRPGLASTDHVRDRHRRDFELLKHRPLVERPQFELADAAVAELLVEPDRGFVLDEHLEPEPLHAARSSAALDRPRQLLADPLAAAAGDDADSTDPRVCVPHGEHAEADVRAGVGGDDRSAEVVVPRPGHERERGLVDRDGHEVAHVAGGEERGELRVRTVGGRLERDGSHRARAYRRRVTPRLRPWSS